MEGRQESDQLPEQGPAGQVPDDSRGQGREDPGRDAPDPREEETGTGNPEAAGAEDPDEEED